MTEDEWNLCTDPAPMLAFLRGRASERKLRLFAAACCRRIRDCLVKIGTKAVDVAERYAEGLATAKELQSTENLAWWGADALNYEEDHIWNAGWAAHAAVAGNPEEAAALAAMAARRDDEPEDQCHLVRDIFGPLPFRPVSLDPAWLAWRGGTIPRLAGAIYEDRELPSGHLDPARLAVLADALEEAGCTDPDLLVHLRGPGPHVRGCFAVDLLSGRE